MYQRQWPSRFYGLLRIKDRKACYRKATNKPKQDSIQYWQDQNKIDKQLISLFYWLFIQQRYYTQRPLKSVGDENKTDCGIYYGRAINSTSALIPTKQDSY